MQLYHHETYHQLMTQTVNNYLHLSSNLAWSVYLVSFLKQLIDSGRESRNEEERYWAMVDVFATLKKNAAVMYKLLS